MTIFSIIKEGGIVNFWLDIGGLKVNPPLYKFFFVLYRECLLSLGEEGGNRFSAPYIEKHKSLKA